MAGNLIIVSAPSGTGKTTLVKDIIKRDSDIRSAVSYTSRSARAGEIDGVSYHFVTRDVFKQMIEHGDFLEWAEVHGNLYGTSRRMVDEWRAAGFDVILTIDVQGAETVRISYPEAIGIFIFPPSYQDLIGRLSARDGSSSGDLALRMQNALTEISQYHRFDYVVINDNLGKAIEELAAIILAERCRTTRRTESVDKILKTFFNNQSKGK
ncbi:MAG: guanylate kinase [Blastocatellia bacterium]|nr:guanylate kinase [Blastocatellia bacterium]